MKCNQQLRMFEPYCRVEEANLKLMGIWLGVDGALYTHDGVFVYEWSPNFNGESESNRTVSSILVNNL